MATTAECPPSALWTSIFILSVILCHGAGGIEAQTRRIPDDEMKALAEIAKQLKMKGNVWNRSLNYCREINGSMYWYPPTSVDTYKNIVWCKCTSDDECHITAMYVSTLSLSTCIIIAIRFGLDELVEPTRQ
ncbi:hypothetical protein NMG60_11015212 [Bertholletia excelsa]